MNIAALCKASSTHTNKEKLQRDHPAKYAYSVTREGSISLYTSDEPATALAEAWLKKIGRQVDAWCLVEALNDHTVFFMFVSGDDVKKAITCEVNQLDTVLLLRSDRVFLVNLPESTLGQYGDCPTATSLAPLTEAEYAPFDLKPVSTVRWRAVVVGAVLLAMCGGGYALLRPQSLPESPVSPLDPYLAYRTSVSQALSAKEILQNTVALGAYGLLLPTGWPLDTISLQGDNLTLTANRSPLGTQAVIKQWLQQQNALTPFSTVTIDTLTIRIPLSATLSAWRDTIMPVGQSTTRLFDAQTTLGWTVRDVIHTDHRVSTSIQWSLTKTAMLTDIATLIDTVAMQPISISSLTLTPTQPLGRYATELSLAFTGENP
ncbi:hypothetical protein L4D77_19340 [Photobacterium frigidiphilum]|uniref:hypothetical protein n=1 Tax=Photobacterium frigidiphilum TaxID=264736 RepID=UPI003D0C4873